MLSSVGSSDYLLISTLTMTASLEQKTQKLSLDNEEGGTTEPIAATPVVVNKAVVGDWADAIKAYKGPKLNQHAIDCPTWYGSERLDHLFRTSGC